MPFASHRLEVDDALECIEPLPREHRTDALPIAPPTERRVRQFLDAAGLATDTINRDRNDRPPTVIGLDQRVTTTGKALACAQGYPGLEFAVFPYCLPERGSAVSKAELPMRGEWVVAQIRRILSGVD